MSVPSSALLSVKRPDLRMSRTQKHFRPLIGFMAVARRNTQHPHTQAITQTACSPKAARNFDISLSVNKLPNTANIAP